MEYESIKSFFNEIKFYIDDIGDRVTGIRQLFKKLSPPQALRIKA